jgi:hypothetical protein
MVLFIFECVYFHGASYIYEAAFTDEFGVDAKIEDTHLEQLVAFGTLRGKDEAIEALKIYFDDLFAEDVARQPEYVRATIRGNPVTRTTFISITGTVKLEEFFSSGSALFVLPVLMPLFTAWNDCTGTFAGCAVEGTKLLDDAIAEAWKMERAAWPAYMVADDVDACHISWTSQSLLISLGYYVFVMLSNIYSYTFLEYSDV